MYTNVHDKAIVNTYNISTIIRSCIPWGF